MNDDGKKVQKPKRKYLKEEYTELADIIITCAEALKNTIIAIKTPNEIESKAKVLHDAETQGDIIQDRLLKSFALEKHPPILQLDRIELLNRMDKVANKCEHAATQIELAGEFFPLDLLPDLNEIMDEVLRTVNAVANGSKLLFDSFEEGVESVKDVEDIRDKTRIMVYKLQVKALKNPETTHQRLFAVDKISTRIQQVAERSKQTADLIIMMKLKFL